MSTSNSDNIHDQVFELLPWWANNTLSAEQHKLVANHIGQCTKCQSEIQFITSLNDEINVHADATYSVSADRNRDFNNVMQRVNQSNRKPIRNSRVSLGTVDGSANNSGKSITDIVIDFLSPFKIQWAMPALVLVLAVIVGTQFQRTTQESGSGYQVLSSDTVSNTGIHISVQFLPTANKEDIREFIMVETQDFAESAELEEQNDGSYLIVFPDSIDVADLNQVVSELKRSNLVMNVKMVP